MWIPRSMIAGLTGKTMFNCVKKLTNYLQKEGEGEVTYSCPTLCDSVDCSLPGSSIQGILQARTLEWVAMPFPSAWKWKVKVKLLSRVWLLATPWTAAHQAPPSRGFSRQATWNFFPPHRTPSPTPAAISSFSTFMSLFCLCVVITSICIISF